MKGWKNLFREHILERGRNYYYVGAVTEFQKTKNGYRAIVEGTEDYEVEIEIEEGNICDMYCSCPYAEDGNYCKHMAAVLYKMEETEGEENEIEETWMERRIRASKELEETIEKIPEEELRILLKELAEQNDEIYNMILTRYAVRIDEKQMNRLKQEVDNIVYQYGDRSGFIDYRNAWDFTSALQDFLNENVETLIERNCYLQAFEMTNYVFKIIGNIDIDDSDGGTSYVADICYEKWKKILENCNDEEKNKLFSWFLSHQGCGYVIDYMEDYMEEFLMNEFQNREMLERKLKSLDEMIEKQKSSTDGGSTWSVHYGYQDNVLKRLEIMKKLNYSDEEIKEYRKKNRQFSAVRKLEIQENLACGNINQAIEILQESKNLDIGYPGLISEYSKQLIDLYEKHFDKKAYKKELLFYIFECPQNDLVYINKLKAICTDEEWRKYRERILESNKNYYIQYPLMEAEGLYERMLENMKNELFIYRLDEYEKVLKKIYPEQVRDIYISYLYKESERSSDRKRYKEWMRYLKKIKGYPDGKEKAKEIAEKWRAMYYRRTAMMDELRKAGF